MPIIGILASGMSTPNYASWMAYFTNTTRGWGVIANSNSVCSVGGDGTGKLIAKYNTNGSVSWQRTLDYTGSTTPDVFRSVTTDSSGNIYAGGHRSFAKYNSSGTIQWQKNFSSSTSLRLITGITTDSSGNVYIQDTPGSATWIVAKLTSSAGITWAKIASVSLKSIDSNISGIVVDSSGNVYVTDGYATDPDAYNGYYIQKFNSSGVAQWTRSRGGGIVSYARTYDCVVDSTGSNVYVVGAGTGGTSSITNSMWVSKTDSSGTIQWTRQFSGQNSQIGQGIAIDSSDNIYGVGYYSATSGAASRSVIGKWNSAGTLQFQRTLSATLSGTAKAIEISGISIDNTNSRMVINGNLDTELFTMRVPLDGSLTGTYTLGSYSIVYSASSLTESSLTQSYSNTALTWTDYTTALFDTTNTDAASSYTNNLVTL